MSFTNLYYKRTAGTPKACYVCYKPTTTVLATINTVDFLYTCPTHLVDPGFASLISEPKATPTVSAEEIAKVKAEWEEKQKKKAEKEKEKEREKEKEKEKRKEKDEKDSSKDKASNGEKEAASSSRTSVSPALPSSAPATPSHERYALHRDFFAMRQSEHRRRRQTKQAKELAPRLPGAPTGGV